MTQQLRARLADLAQDAPRKLDADDLWRRGRQQAWLRLARAGVLGAAVLAVIALGGGLTWQRLAPISGAASTGAGVTGFPNRVWAPSPWLSGTAHEGPLGRLAVAATATRDSFWHSSEGVVGVSAGAGRYRFLDLPDRAPSSELALAPDGRHLAYWLSGTVSGVPNLSPGQRRPVVGIAVYNTVTGGLERFPIASRRGLDAQVGGIAWVGANHLLVSAWRWQTGTGGDGSSVLLGTLLGTVGKPGLSPVERRGAWAVNADTGTWPGGLAVSRGTSVRLIPATGGRGTTYRLSSPPTGGVFVDPSGSRVAAWRGTGDPAVQNNHPAPIYIGALTATKSTVTLREVPHARVLSVLGWRDATHILAGTGSGVGWRLVSVDIDTGQVRTVSTFSWNAPGANPAGALAMDLLRGPTVTAAAPPRPWSPRLVGLGVAGVVLGGLVLGRRLVRR